MDQNYLPHEYHLERLASAWLGAMAKQFPEQNQQAEHIDLMFNAQLARITGNISPAALANAYFDWLKHLQLSPAKQVRLCQLALEKFWHWQVYAISAMRGNCTDPSDCIIQPLPQDKRFKDEAWADWPFNVISQGF